MPDPTPKISIHGNSVRARDADRAQLDAQVQAFLRKRGNQVEVLPGLQKLPTRLDYRAEQTRYVQADRAQTAHRRRRSADHA